MKTRRVLLMGLLSAMPLLAEAEPWRSEVKGPSGLPDVAVTLGYNGGHVSSVSSPIVLDIRGGDRPFDGYIGFRIAAGEKRTVDGTVVTPVTLAPRASHRFSTWARTVTYNGADPTGREIVIEWRDRDMRVLASDSAGAPPWVEQLPLVLPFDGLGTTAQWYAGFSRLVTPIDHWFELPREVRRAVFHSGIHVVFVGVPSTIPAMMDIDRALLPIEIRSGAAVLDIPWPYASDKERQRSVNLGWVAKEGTRTIGSPQLPYLVSSREATFAASDAVLDMPLPVFTNQLHRERAFDRPVQRRPRLREILLDYRPLIVAVALLPLPFLGWTAMRRRPRWTILAMAIVAVTLIAVRDLVPATSADQEVTLTRVVSHDMFETTHADRDTGAIPIPAAAPPGADAVTHPSTSFDAVEVRTSATPPGFGAVDSARPWESMVRRSVRRELGSPSTIRTRAAGSEAVAVAFESPMPVDYVSVIWMCEGRRCSGTVPAGSKVRGEVTVRNGIDSWSCPTCPFDSLAPSAVTDFNTGQSVELIHITANGGAVVRHLEPLDAVHPAPYALSAFLERKGALLVAAFALSSGSTEALKATVGLRAVDAVSPRVTFRGERGAVELTKDMKLPDDALSRIAPDGGIVTVEIETDARASSLSHVRLVIEERKS